MAISGRQWCSPINGPRDRDLFPGPQRGVAQILRRFGRPPFRLERRAHAIEGPSVGRVLRAVCAIYALGLTQLARLKEFFAEQMAHGKEPVR
jgi:hypothetical protein